jgi:hypothetical protein
MPDIRYVCVSDLHLGADNSVLTHMKPNSIDTDSTQPSPLMVLFVACLKELIEQNQGQQKPILILNGDILELALAETNDAAMMFERFIELIFPENGEPLFDKNNILYIPGNHDHHIWEIARETQYVNYLDGVPPGGYFESPWHTTKMFFPDLVRGYFVTDLLQRYPHLKHTVINIVYPNYAITSDDGQKCIIFNHGHYIEPIYSLISTLNTMVFPNRIRPKTVQELEAENFAWVDFFWSTMGRSGGAGQDIGLVYDKLQDTKQLEKLAANFSRSLSEHLSSSKLFESIDARILNSLLDFILNRRTALERHQSGQLLSIPAQQGLKSYLEGPLLEQIRSENNQIVPADITFIFGHTHKPFSQVMNFTGYPTGMKVYNSGGWVADTLQPIEIFGAAAILIDETLQSTSLRLYNQSTSASGYTVRVEEATHPGATNSLFYERIRTLVKPESDPWKTFSETAAEAVRLHEWVLQTKINL